MKKTLIPAALLALLLAACGGEKPAAPETAEQAPAVAEASSPAEAATASEAAAAPVGELVAVCKEAEALENQYIETLNGAEKEERIQHRDTWLASLKEATAAEQEENCKQAIEELKED
ncbi:MAG: anti-anti-sigma factor [Eikenella sp.]|nr:anti-anti-sigma factor [Eikenella sp.]